MRLASESARMIRVQKVKLSPDSGFVETIAISKLSTGSIINSPIFQEGTYRILNSYSPYVRVSYIRQNLPTNVQNIDRGGLQRRKKGCECFITGSFMYKFHHF